MDGNAPVPPGPDWHHPYPPAAPAPALGRRWMPVAVIAGAIIVAGALVGGAVIISHNNKVESNAASGGPPSGSTMSPLGTAVPTNPSRPGGKQVTIADYLKENNVTETAVRAGDPGSPKVSLPIPPGWSDAGARAPNWAFSAIVYNLSETPNDPPSVIAIVSELTGTVNPETILELAPGELKNLKDFQPLGDAQRTTLDGFDAMQISGTYTRDGHKRIITQTTLVIPSPHGLYVLQLNADARYGQKNVLTNITKVIDEKMTITP